MVFVICVVVVASTTFHCVAASYSWCFISTSFMMCSLVSFFHYYVAIFYSSAKSEVHHSGDHDAITLNIASSIAMNGSFTHVQAKYFCARIYRLCKLLYNIEDKRNLWLIHVQMLTSVNT